MKDMYEPVDKNCPDCNGTGSISKAYGGDAYYTSYNVIRCKCSYIKTKKFAKYEDNNAWIRTSSAMDGY